MLGSLQPSMAALTRSPHSPRGFCKGQSREEPFSKQEPQEDRLGEQDTLGSTPLPLLSPMWFDFRSLKDERHEDSAFFKEVV